MYDAIEKATEASINPVPKNGKIETRIRNFESKINMKRNLEEIFFYFVSELKNVPNSVNFLGKSSSTVQKTISKISVSFYCFCQIFLLV